MAKRKLTPRQGDGPPPDEPPDDGWTLEEAMRKLAGEDLVEAYLAAWRRHSEARSAKPEPRLGWNRDDFERDDEDERHHRRSVEAAFQTLAEKRRDLMSAFRAALRAHALVTEGRQGTPTEPVAPIALDQWDSLDAFDLERSIAAESRPGGTGFFSVRVRRAASQPAAKGGRPSSVDWNAALDAFLLDHIWQAEFETKAHLVEAFATAIERSSGRAPDESTVRKWLSTNLPRLYARAGAPERDG